MASDMATRRLRKELMAIKRNPVDNIVAVPLDSNILEWHYVITGTAGSPYEGGHYHGKLRFPPEYPMKPPSVTMLTPNGRFACARRLCLSMSDFHPESWNPMWSVSTILMGLYSFMLDSASTLGSVMSSTGQKKKFAAESLEFNCKNPAFRKLFPDLVELHENRKQDASTPGAMVATSGGSVVRGAHSKAAPLQPQSDPASAAAGAGTGAAGGATGTPGSKHAAATAAPQGGAGEVLCWLSLCVAIGACGLAYVLAAAA